MLFLGFAMLLACGRVATSDDVGALLDSVAVAYGGLEHLSRATAFQE